MLPTSPTRLMWLAPLPLRLVLGFGLLYHGSTHDGQVVRAAPEVPAEVGADW